MNPQLNKKVKKYLDSYFRDTKKNSPEHHEAVMLVMRGALTDANFHSEAKELGKYFPKAGKKYVGTPMEDVIEDKGIDIAKMAKWDGHDIIDAFAFYLSMSIGGSFGNRLMSLKESLEESLVSEGERLDEKNCPTDASKWSYYKSQAKKKFDVYPSAYANGWASKQYKSAGGGWKACKKESIDEKMVTPKRGHAYYKLTKDTLIKYISGHSGIGLEVPGVLLHNEYGTIKGKKGAYIIDYFGAHFYVDIKNKFASRIANPQNREQNKDLMKNVERVFSAPEHSDWKKYMNEALVNELNTKTYRSAVEKGLERGDDKGREIARKAIELMGKSLSKELKDVVLTIKPLKVNDFHSSHFSAKPPMTGQYQIKFTGAGNLHKPDLNLDTKDITLFVKGELGQAKEYGGWGGPIELDRYIGWKPITLQLSIRNGSVEVYSYRGGGGLQFTRQGARLIAKIAKEINLSMGGDGNVKHNKIKQFTPHKNESVNEAASRTAMEIGGYTGLNKNAIQKFVDDNNLDIEKVYQFVKKGKLADRMKLVSAIAGRPNNPVQKQVIKQFSESLIKEAKLKLGKDVVNFRVSPNVRDAGLTLLAASGNDLDKLQDAIANDVDVKSELLKMLEKQLKLPMNIDYDYQGAGFAFKFDLYSIAKKVK